MSVSERLRVLRGYLLAFVAVVGMSFVIGIAIDALRLTRLSTLYLVVVLAAATRLGRGPAIFASAVAFLVYDWFFTAPFHQLTIRDPEEWISLGLFLVTAIITSQLAANERARVEQAERREREALLLFDALRLMSDPDLDAALNALAQRLCDELKVSAVTISLAVGPRTWSARAGVAGVLAGPTELLGGGRRPTAKAAGGPARWIRLIPPGRSQPDARGWRHSEVPIVAGDDSLGKISLARAVDARAFTHAENQVLAVIAASVGAVAQRTELREATTRAEILRRTDELKSTLLAAVSHDLRTPLASIIASAGSLRGQDVQWTDTERRDFVADIEQEARRLSRIVDNLLDLSRMESGALRPDRAWYDVAALIDDVLGRLGPLTERHLVELEVADDLPPVLLDYVEIDQVLSNLVENAVRHTPAGTTIGVGARVERSDLVVEVTDSGPGLEPGSLGRIFEPFVRGPARRGAPSGTGLGLAIVRRLVEAHGGRASAANRPDGGALFSFTLPLSDTPATSRREVTST